MVLDMTASPESALPCFVMVAATGGLQAFSQILAAVQAPVPPIVAIPRIHPAYAAAFAERLQRVCRLTVKIAAEGDDVLPDLVLVDPGDPHIELVGSPPRARVTLRGAPPVAPGERFVSRNADLAFQSAARVYGRHAVGILLTGMGRDGVDGCKAILDAGGTTLGQDAATSLLYHTSKIALAEGALTAQFPLDQLRGILQNFCAYRNELEKVPLRSSRATSSR
jgi:two-component system, chemotaxis family, protein-glutamate methylesterase/glutaminase